MDEFDTDDDYDVPSDIRHALKKTRRSARKRRWEFPMDDVPVFAPPSVPKNEVVLGTYGSLEWVNADSLRNRHLQGKQTLELSETWITPSGFKLANWVIENKFKSFTFFESNIVCIPFEEGLIQINASKGKITANLVGGIEFCSKWNSLFASQFKRAENLIRWIYNARGDDISVPLNYRKGINAAYPWLRKSYEDYIKGYLDSEASVLILIGPPGTGKTTFIKNVIHQSKGGARVAYDETVLNSDGFFASFIDGEDDILVMEDADAFLSSRQDGNTMMHKFLNVSDGLISAIGKKIIFSTNLPNISDIDEALLRAGRCYDVVQFRPLTRAEAQQVLDETGSNGVLPDGNELTLAQIFCSQPSADKPKRGMGFTA